MIDPNKHVYCSRCAHFEVIEDIDEDDEMYILRPQCQYMDKCDIWDCEDSKPFKDRPFYKEII